MNTTRLLLIGGFLGAGKTTLLSNIAQRLTDAEHQIGLVTNDQAPGLVDTQFLLQNNRHVAEVSGSCFCCNFNGLLDALRKLQKNTKPTVILAEPVGSCTDLSATLIQPLKEQLEKDFILSPLSVVVDVQRLQQILNGTSNLHPSAEYILHKQLEEADVIVINKIDTISENTIEELRSKLHRIYPAATFFFLSARTGAGVPQWLDTMMQRNDAGTHIVEVDYDRYAEGEAVLGWLNTTIRLSGRQTNWHDFAAALMSELSSETERHQASVGHVKAFFVTETKESLIANLTGTKETLNIRGPAVTSSSARLTLNARIEISPQQLEHLIHQTLNILCGTDLTLEIETWQSLSPGRPNPTHRYDHVIPSVSQ